MEFLNGKLQGARELALVHRGRPSQPTKIAIHYTVTDTLNAASNALNSAGLSYHFLVDRDGGIFQTRSPHLHAAHAGRSNWKQSRSVGNGDSLNEDAVSISFINRGFFGRSSGSHFFDANAHGNLIGASVPAAEVRTRGSLYHPTLDRHWHLYSDAQVAASFDIVRALKREFPAITEIVGHDDVSIDGKSDPGPLFPMQAARDEFGLSGGLGMRVAVQSPDGELTLRQRPTANSTNLGVLHNGDDLHIRSVVYSYRSSAALHADRPSARYLTPWASVDVEGTNRHAGFVHMKFLTGTPLSDALEVRL